MKHRFQYLDERGRQVTVPDLAGLREHVQSGRVDDETLLYDRFTDEWAPAAFHPAYQLLDDPLARGPGEKTDGGPATGDEAGAHHGKGVAKGSAAAGPPSGGREPAFPDIDMTLAPAGEAESTEEVVEKLLKERERDRGRDLVPTVSESFSGGRELSKEPEADTSPPDPASSPAEEESTTPAAQPVVPRRRPGVPRERRRREPTPATRRIQVPAWALVLGGFLVLSVGFYSGARILTASRASEAEGATADPGDATSAVVRTPGNPAWVAAEGGAFQDMLEGVDSLRHVYGVAHIPRTWLSGPYLADAGSFTEVRAYWESYLEFVDAVRSQDTALFRSGFVRRLEAQSLSGPIVSIRLARALETFNESQPARDTVYERMADLALSSLDLHDLLVERAADIEYDPVTEERASRQPILEAWSEDPYLRQTIWTLLDRITANLALLENDTGSAHSDLTERLFQELRSRSLVPPDRDGSG